MVIIHIRSIEFPINHPETHQLQESNGRETKKVPYLPASRVTISFVKFRAARSPVTARWPASPAAELVRGWSGMLWPPATGSTASHGSAWLNFAG